MSVLDLFWLICKAAIALAMFAALCYVPYRLWKAFEDMRREWRVRRTKKWILSRDMAELLVLISEENVGRYFDKQDLDGLVQLAFNTYPEGQKDAIVTRLAVHLNYHLFPDLTRQPPPST